MPAHGVVTLEVMLLLEKREGDCGGGRDEMMDGWGWGRRIAGLRGTGRYPRERIRGSFKSLVSGRFGYGV